MRERNDECLCTVPFRCLSLLFIVCFCSVVHRTVYTSARSCLSARTIHNLVARLKIPRLRRSHKKFITMSSMFALAHERSTHTSSSSIPSSRTTSQVKLPINKHCATPPEEESGPLAKITSSTGYEPNVSNTFDNSKTTEIFLQEQSSDTMPSYLHDVELSDETIGKALSSPLFTQEREEPAGRRQAYHSFEESLLPSQSLSVCHVRTGRPVHELSSLGSSIREKPSREMEELQKRHVLKVEELPRRKLTEDFFEVTSFFQGSNVKTVYNLGDNDAKYPDADIDDEHTWSSLASPLYLQERKATASLLQVYHSQRESLFQRAQSNFSKCGETRNLDATKEQI